MSDKLYLLSTCDSWHSHDSMRPQGIYSSIPKAVEQALGMSTSQDEGKLSEHDLYLLTTIKQTQDRADGFIIEEFVLNQYFYE